MVTRELPGPRLGGGVPSRASRPFPPPTRSFRPWPGRPGADRAPSALLLPRASVALPPSLSRLLILCPLARPPSALVARMRRACARFGPATSVREGDEPVRASPLAAVVWCGVGVLVGGRRGGVGRNPGKAGLPPSLSLQLPLCLSPSLPPSLSLSLSPSTSTSRRTCAQADSGRPEPNERPPLAAQVPPSPPALALPRFWP